MPFSYHTKVGDRFGSRVITGFLAERDTDGHLRCLWKCDCGTTGTAGLKSLRHTANCQKCRNQYQEGRPTHGHAGEGTRTKLYDAWANMLQRVRGTGSPSNRRWYSDKGIAVCEAWQKFEGFRDWALANGWEEGLSLDRTFARGNYEPRNCEWITRAENSRRAAQDVWRRYDHFPIEMLWGGT
jgi:hypothetical protein